MHGPCSVKRPSTRCTAWLRLRLEHGDALAALAEQLRAREPRGPAAEASWIVESLIDLGIV